MRTQSASLHMTPDDDFDEWQQLAESAIMRESLINSLQREVLRIVEPQMAVATTLQGVTQMVHLPATATTDDLLQEVKSLHGLDDDTEVTLIVKGIPVPPGMELQQSIIAIPTGSHVPDAWPVLVMTRPAAGVMTKPSQVPSYPEPERGTVVPNPFAKWINPDPFAKWTTRSAGDDSHRSDLADSMDGHAGRQEMDSTSGGASAASDASTAPAQAMDDPTQVANAPFSPDAAAYLEALRAGRAETALLLEELAAARLQLDSFNKELLEARQHLAGMFGQRSPTKPVSERYPVVGDLGPAAHSMQEGLDTPAADVSAESYDTKQIVTSSNGSVAASTAESAEDVVARMKAMVAAFEADQSQPTAGLAFQAGSPPPAERARAPQPVDSPESAADAVSRAQAMMEAHTLIYG